MDWGVLYMCYRTILRDPVATLVDIDVDDIFFRDYLVVLDRDLAEMSDVRISRTMSSLHR